MRRAAVALACLIAVAANAATTNNDDSCDIGVAPAATLLLPYFEVELDKPLTGARTTIFTVVNTSQYPQIARVTLWTDLAYPVMNFNLFLTGYDVQPVNLYWLLRSGATSGFLTGAGERSLPNDMNPNHASIPCQPTELSEALLADVRSILTTGRGPSCSLAGQLGLVHQAAIGYATIDVVNSCNATFPNDKAYYDELLYDNVLIGDYEHINPDPTIGNYASASPLVHIRAIPEGGLAGAKVTPNLPRTFYDRYTPRESPHIDRRQPLPSAFAARFLQGGTGAFNTNLQIWREGLVGGTDCASYAQNFGTALPIRDKVRFDEHENPTTMGGEVRIAAYQTVYYTLSAASSTPTSASMFPPLSSSGDVGGWIYLNLTNPAWVTTVMSAEGRYSVAYDAQMMGNGCSPFPWTVIIGPAPNVQP